MPPIDPPPVARSHSHRWLPAVFACIWIVPLLRALLLVHQYSVSVFFGDDFDLANFLNISNSHGIRWADLIAQHNESRFLTIRSLTLMLARLHRPFDIRILMLASLGTATFTSYMLLRLIQRTFGNSSISWIIAIVVNVLLFFPSQWLNFLWGVQWIVFVPAAGLAMGLVVLNESVPLKFGLPLAAFGAAIANYTNSNGLLVWALLLPPLLWRRSPHHAVSAAAWVFLASVSVGYYFHEYMPPAGSSSARIALAHPAVSLQFVLAFLGNGLRCSDRPTIAIWIGGGASILLIIASVVLFSGGNRKSLPWFIFAAYSICSALLAAAGRIELGTLGAITPRYATFSIPLYIALLVVWILVIQSIAKKIWVMPIAMPPVAVLLLLCLLSSRFVGGEMKHYRAARLTSLALVQWSEVITNDPSTVHALFPAPQYAYTALAGLKQNGFLPRDLFFRPDQIQPMMENAQNSPTAGRMDSLTLTQSDLQLTGCALLPYVHRSADAVLITTRFWDGTFKIIAITGDVRRAHSTAGKPSDMGWDCIVAGFKTRDGKDLSAWAYDAVEKKMYRLERF